MTTDIRVRAINNSPFIRKSGWDADYLRAEKDRQKEVLS